MTYVVGADLGQAADFTAKAFIHREYRETKQVDEQRGVFCEEHYTIRQIQRPPLKTPYTDIVSELSVQMRHENLAGADLVVDATGAGRPVIDMMRAAGLSPIPVTITGGVHITQDVDTGFWHVPKRVLVSSMAVALQSARLHIVRTLPLAPVWQREAMAFKVKITKAANDTYEAWRDGEHDDLVLATALAVWWAERTSQPGYRHTFKTAEAARKEARRAAHVTGRERPFWDKPRRGAS